jgi:membrane-associated phospholipid phosphatase
MKAGQLLSSRWRYLLLAVTIVLLLLPGTIISSVMALLLIGPVAVTGIRARDRSFFYWALYIVSFAVYARIRGVADDIGPGPFARYVIVLDQVLGFGTVPTLALQRWYLPGTPHWWDYAGLAVYLTHYFAVPVTALLTWRLAPAVLPRLLLSVSAGLLIGAIIHVLAPTVPPWIAGQTGDLPTVYRPLVDLLSGLAPGVYEFGARAAGQNDVSAMPSMHVAAATYVALAARTGPRWVAILGVAYPLLMALTLVYFGEHYVVDAIAGSALALGTWVAVSRSAKDAELPLERP